MKIFTIAKFTPLLAQAATGSLSSGASSALGIVMLIGFLFGTLCVIGGGFANLGGQNLIQPLALGKPVVHGPHMQNFRSATASADAAGAALVAFTASELTQTLDRLFADSELRSKMGAAAAKLVKDNLGASERYAEAVAEAARDIR